MAITNDNRIGNLFVAVIAVEKAVAKFQTRDLANAKLEAERIWFERMEQGLPTRRIYAREIINNRNSPIPFWRKVMRWL